MASAFTISVLKTERAIKTSVIVEDQKSVSQKLTAVWDTGATATTINIKIAKSMGLVSIGKRNSSTANGECEAEIYLVNLILPNNVKINNLPISGLDLVNTEMVIGMDIILMGQFTISSNNNTLLASFVMPTLEMKDYIQDLKKIDRARFKNIGRNDPCPCGSGKKYKNCCWDKHH